MLTLLRKLVRIRLLTVGGLINLFSAILSSGVNLMALLHYAAQLHPGRRALCDDLESLSYGELWQQSEVLAGALQTEMKLNSQQQVALLCRNHTVAVKCMFAFSRLGAHLYLLNPEMSKQQFTMLDERFQFDLIVYDEAVAHFFEAEKPGCRLIPSYHPTELSIERLIDSNRGKQFQLGRCPSGQLVVLTGGTSGQPKSAKRKPSLFAFLPPLFALLITAHLDQYQSLYVATPLCHGYGIAWLLIGVVLGMELHISERFEATRACALIAERKIQAITLVPLMLQRMLNLNVAALSPLRCIICGSAPLSPALARLALDRLGAKLYNLYGSSEAGFSIMATPELLSRKANSIGKPIRGVQAKIADFTGATVNPGEIGQLLIRSSWTSQRKQWIETGDLARCDSEGDIILCGRVDEMVVSGGEKVYPVEVEAILHQHSDVETVVVVGIPDAEFGQRLKAFVKVKGDRALDAESLKDWLKPRLARYQMPAQIEFRSELPYTAIGKVDKRALKSLA